MGAITFSLDPRLVEALGAAIDFQVFVETGTFKGDTTHAMVTRFPQIHSIESSELLWNEARARFKDEPRITLHHGDSPALLRQLQIDLQPKPVLYWLDAHWCVASGECSQCPLLEELAALGRLNAQSVVLIDDARLFLAPPPQPHESTHWPNLHQVIQALQTLSDSHEIMVINDVIAFFPTSARQAMQAYGQACGVNWLAAMHQVRDYQNLASQFSHAQHQLADKENRLQRQHILINQLSAQQTGVAQPRTATPAQAKEPQADKPADEADMPHAQGLLQMLHEKEEVIQALAKALRVYRSLYTATWPARVLAQLLNSIRQLARVLLLPARWGAAGIRALLKPGLGVLYQHPPKALVLPAPKPRPRPPGQAPTISLVTPSFRQGHYIERTLRSVLDQQYPHLEYWVQDGGSKDDTVKVLERYQGQLAGWVSEKDNGQSQAINRGFAKTSGEIMAWLNSDDLLLPGALATVADYFMRHPEVDVVYGNRVLIDENDQEIGRWILPGHDGKVLSWADFVPQETLFWRRRIWERVGGIDESFRFAMDWDLLVRFRDAGARFAHIPQCLGAFRIHEAQKTSANINDVGMQEMMRIRERLLGRQPSYAEIRKAILPFMLKHLVADRLHRLSR